MKKKFFKVLTVSGLALMLAACSLSPDTKADKASVSLDSSVSFEGSTEPNAPHSEAEPTHYVKGNEVDTPDYLLSNCFESIYSLKDGELDQWINTECMRDFYEIIAINGKDFLSSENILAEDGYFDLCIKATNVETGLSKRILSLNHSLEGIDLYNGYIYVGEFNYSDHKFREHAIDQTSYEEVSDGLWINPDIDFSDCYQVNYYADRKYASRKRILDETGFILYEDSFGDIYKLDGNTLDKCVKSDTYLDYLCYNSEYLYGTEYSYEDEAKILYRVNLESGECTKVYGPIEELIGVSDGKIYVRERSGELLNYSYTYTVIDENTLESTKIKDIERAEVGGYYYIYESKVKDGKLYFVDFDGDCAVKWYCYDGEIKDISTKVEPLKVLNQYRLADVKAVETRNVCETCNEYIYAEKYEYPVLHSDIKNASKISQYLKERAESMGAFSKNSEEFAYYSLECESHNFAPCFDYENVDDIEYLGSHFLSVAFSGEWYGGGAHGSPNRDNLIFDLDTGKLVEFTDLYKGEKNELCDIIATGAKALLERSLRGEDYNPFYADEPDRVYADAYELAEIGQYGIDYLENGAIIYFYPYDMGPYAAGFIDLYFSYEELGIKEALGL